jgi:aminoacyl tRNA synthase complex-interacting multifunctional protein 1
LGNISTEYPTEKHHKADKKPKVKPENNNKASASDPDQPDICKLEFKVGRITKVWAHPDADKLYCEEIDCGEEGGPRQIASGLRHHYSEEDMLGKKVLVVANLKVRLMMDIGFHRTCCLHFY